MCEMCDARGPGTGARGRRRIWEVFAGWHCSIIGTCLTLGDLRVLARKLGYQGRKGTDSDYQLHGHFVREMSEKDRAAKLVNKLLDRKHAAAIRRFQRAATTDELAAAWDAAFEAGDIPGPYWAVLTHPLVDDDLGLRVYGEVHMLSHLVGASNRADIAALRQMEAEIAALQERQEKDGRRHQQRVGEKDRLIGELRREVGSAKGRLARTAEQVSRSVDDDAAGNVGAEAMAAENESLKNRLAVAAAEIEELRAANAQLSATVSAFESEVRALEHALARDAAPVPDEGCLFDLSGRCILYVGGRTPQVCRLRTLVARWNGELLHHDGGVERSLDELAGAIVKADAVVFPTDCVSHNAVRSVKRLCRQTMKPYVPLRTSGVASFVAGLRDGLEGTASLTDPS